ncbi:phosphoglycerate mutase-like protein [Gymnopus androsaceus JB14]|uniref:Phosphoglycerate mutase-like protein n=1 Tax=Gymnopus androsaceus JB14 TaxID=1447944 RepID=A0A6A4HCG5_9AGAR|nr:phosphoglycerate mutase-like protein [Gymnopus androsaceus JB14]
MTLTVTFVRHGESFDNLRENWAGWKDAPLSDLDEMLQQATAVGEYFASTKFDAIYASTLLRANATEPFPSFIVTPKIREQHFGEAEGKPWTYSPPEHSTLEELFAKGIYPVLFERDEKFPGAESLNDLAARADEAITECIVPHLRFGKDHHIALVSHGLCISELIAALLRLDPDSRRDISYKGLLNTAWTRVTVSIKGDAAYSEGVLLDVQVTHVNVSDHLKNIAITSDASQNSEARKFFGGGGEIADAAQSEERNRL